MFFVIGITVSRSLAAFYFEPAGTTVLLLFALMDVLVDVAV